MEVMILMPITFRVVTSDLVWDRRVLSKVMTVPDIPQLGTSIDPGCWFKRPGRRQCQKVQDVIYRDEGEPLVVVSDFVHSYRTEQEAEAKLPKDLLVLEDAHHWKSTPLNPDLLQY